MEKFYLIFSAILGNGWYCRKTSNAVIKSISDIVFTIVINFRLFYSIGSLWLDKFGNVADNEDNDRW